MDKRKLHSYKLSFVKIKSECWSLEVRDEEWNILIIFYGRNKKECLSQLSEWVKEG